MKQPGRPFYGGDTITEMMKKIHAELAILTDWAESYTGFSEEKLEHVRQEASSIMQQIRELKESMIEFQRNLDA